MDRLIQWKLKFDIRKSARTVTFEFEQDLETLISESTVQRRAHEVGLFGRVDRKKPYVNEANRLKRLKYATKAVGFLRYYCLVGRIKVQLIWS